MQSHRNSVLGRRSKIVGYISWKKANECHIKEKYMSECPLTRKRLVIYTLGEYTVHAGSGSLLCSRRLDLR